MATDLLQRVEERRPAEPGVAVAGTGSFSPRLRSLIVVAAWAAMLAGLGLVFGLRGYFGILGGAAPGWYPAALTILGLVGTALCAGAFLTVRRRRLPGVLLSAASVSLALTILLTTTALD